MSIDANIIKIGNSQGIRIPKAILESCGFNGVVQMQLTKDGLLLTKPTRKPREGWAEQLAESIKKYGVPELLMPDFVNEFDKTEWTWHSEES